LPDSTNAGRYRIRSSHKLCNENSDCSAVNFVFDAANLSCKDDLFRVTLENKNTNQSVNFGQQRIDYALSRGLVQNKADQWGYFGAPWNMASTNNLTPQPDNFTFSQDISQRKDLGHLPVGNYRLIVDSIYNDVRPTTFSFSTAPAQGSSYNIIPPAGQDFSRGVPNYLDKYDYNIAESKSINAQGEFAYSEACLSQTEKIPTDASGGVYIFPAHYNLSCPGATGGDFLRAPIICRQDAPYPEGRAGAPAGKAVYDFIVVPPQP
jgi:hypothetical protein